MPEINMIEIYMTSMNALVQMKTDCTEYFLLIYLLMHAARSMPKSTISQSIPSEMYSSCSTTNMWWLKNCCSFSLTKLIEICSKPLYSKISNPAISNTAVKLAFFIDGSIRVSLHLMISQLKRRL